MIVVPVPLAGNTIFKLCHKGIFVSYCLFALPLTAVAAVSSEYFFPFLPSFTLARLSGLMSIPKPYSLKTNADITTPAPLSLGISPRILSGAVQAFVVKAYYFSIDLSCPNLISALELGGLKTLRLPPDSVVPVDVARCQTNVFTR
jgi:hypothetical protein